MCSETLKPKLPINNYRDILNKAKSSFPQRKPITSTTSAFLTTTAGRCIFCLDSSHSNDNCPLSITDKKISLTNQGRCYGCFGRRLILKNCFKKNNYVNFVTYRIII